jgi:hypothetical protein
MHSARVKGRKAEVTVAMYHGTGAEEVCRALSSHRVVSSEQPS